MKLYDGRILALVRSNQHATQSVSFELMYGAGSKARVLDEDRSVLIEESSFSDNFDDGNTAHLYEIIGGDACGF